MANGIAVCRYCEKEIPTEFHRDHVALLHEDTPFHNHWPASAIQSVRDRILDGEKMDTIATEYGLTRRGLDTTLRKHFGRFWDRVGVRHEHVAHRSRIVARCGHRWSRVARLRKKGESWAAIERQVAPPK